MSAPDLTLTAVQCTVLAAARDGRATYHGGWFCIDGVALPEIDAQQARELIFAGLLVKTGRLLELTDAGREAIA